jgi:hypothetical protein
MQITFSREDVSTIPVEARHSLLHIIDLVEPFFGPYAICPLSSTPPDSSPEAPKRSRDGIPIISFNESIPIVSSGHESPASSTFNQGMSWGIEINEYIQSGRLWDVFRAHTTFNRPVVMSNKGGTYTTEITPDSSFEIELPVSMGTVETYSSAIPDEQLSPDEHSKDTFQYDKVGRSGFPKSTRFENTFMPSITKRTPLSLNLETIKPPSELVMTPPATPSVIVIKFTCPRVSHDLMDGSSGYRVQIGYNEEQARACVLRERRVYEVLLSLAMLTGSIRSRPVPEFYGLFASLQPSLGPDQEIWAMLLEDCGRPITLGKEMERCQ